jgi:hypothetical protein
LFWFLSRRPAAPNELLVDVLASALRLDVRAVPPADVTSAWQDIASDKRNVLTP